MGGDAVKEIAGTVELGVHRVPMHPQFLNERPKEITIKFDLSMIFIQLLGLLQGSKIWGFKMPFFIYFLPCQK